MTARTRHMLIGRVALVLGVLSPTMAALAPVAPPGAASAPVDLEGPALLLALDHSGRRVALAPGDSTPDETTSCLGGPGADGYCGVRSIDRLTGAIRDLPPLLTVSSDQSALITPDGRWLDIASQRSTPIPDVVTVTGDDPIRLSADGRWYAGPDSTLTKGFVVEGATGRARALPVTGTASSISATGRFVVIRASRQCDDPVDGPCDMYVWDQQSGALALVAERRLNETVSNVAADGTVFVSRLRRGDPATRSFYRRPFGGPRIAVRDDAVPDGPYSILRVDDDASTLDFAQALTAPGPEHVIVDTASGAALASFGTTTGSLFMAVDNLVLSGDGATLATQIDVRDAVVSGVPSVGFRTLRTPSARLRPSEELPVTVAGFGNVPVDASAVMLNVTATDPAGAGFLTVWPCGTPRPLASNSNFAPGQTVATAALVQVGSGGRVCVESNAAVNIVVDVQGWLAATSSYTALTPTRVLDTRDGTGSASGSLLSPNGMTLPVVGAGGVAPLATSVALSVTAVDPLADGYIVVWPCGEPRPQTSSLNAHAAATVANLVVTRVGAGGAVCFGSNVETHLVVDLQGWFADDDAYRSITPLRLADTRGGERDAVGNVVGGSTRRIDTQLVSGSAAMLNVTVTNPASAGFAVVWPCDGDRPLASNLNFTAGQTVANAVLAATDLSGDVCISPNVDADLVVDIVGSWSAASPYHAMVPSRAADTRIIDD